MLTSEAYHFIAVSRFALRCQRNREFWILTGNQGSRGRRLIYEAVKGVGFSLSEREEKGWAMWICHEDFLENDEDEVAEVLGHN